MLQKKERKKEKMSLVELPYPDTVFAKWFSRQVVASTLRLIFGDEILRPLKNSSYETIDSMTPPEILIRITPKDWLTKKYETLFLKCRSEVSKWADYTGADEYSRQKFRNSFSPRPVGAENNSKREKKKELAGAISYQLEPTLLATISIEKKIDKHKTRKTGSGIKHR